MSAISIDFFIRYLVSRKRSLITDLNISCSRNAVPEIIHHSIHSLIN